MNWPQAWATARVYLADRPGFLGIVDGSPWQLSSPPRFELRRRSGLRTAREARRTSGGLDLHDLELHLAARSGDLDRLALLLADDRLADRRLVGKLVLG